MWYYGKSPGLDGRRPDFYPSDRYLAVCLCAYHFSPVLCFLFCQIKELIHMASKIFSALTLEESIKEILYQQEGKKGTMCSHTQSCQGSCTCDIIMEEFSPCLPRCKHVIGVRHWETCLVWNSSTPTSRFGQFSGLGICPHPCKVKQTM